MIDRRCGWIPRSFSRRATLDLIAVIATAIILIGTACGTVSDPWDHTFYVSLVDDLNEPVTVEQCGNSCGDIHTVFHMKPGGSVRAVAVDDNIANPWLIVDASGRKLGCVDLVFHVKTPGAVVRLSSMNRGCP